MALLGCFIFPMGHIVPDGIIQKSHGQIGILIFEKLYRISKHILGLLYGIIITCLLF
ncbi:hypothetical protein BACCAP_04515 [Pseudoflavonifractor capillosus ATCC 29799]|uniref:Uncharacterized protein n=1 Tax=Pseudoflavonifractor capillosus ATCC 29799 TaxID=411467 RepID=A6P1Y7_9FIRM|nr:hypothetical protein BACCAP_04515 [Pseudoflavonifractor capillosus ATCC 29799]